MRRKLFPLLLLPFISACSTTVGEVPQLGLSGSLVYGKGTEGLWEANLEIGEIAQLWKVPEGGSVSGIAVSPDDQKIAVAYAPPRAESAIPRHDLYLVERDGSNPKPFLEHTGIYENLDFPIWSPDGRWIYFNRSDVLIDDTQGTAEVVFNISRIPSGGGTPEVVLDHADQATISASGTRMAFVHVNPEGFGRSLWVSNADGTRARELLPEETFLDIWDPQISPDGESIAFAASGQQPSALDDDARDFWSWVFGVQPAFAHGLPWDFWTIAVNGGELTQLTQWSVDATGLSWSPDGEQLALMQLGGLYVTGDDEPTFITENPNHGGLDWSRAP